ncbi:Anthranilate phosphoribosyltransferase, partial [Frankliniella fusca]
LPGFPEIAFFLNDNFALGHLGTVLSIFPHFLQTRFQSHILFASWSSRGGWKENALHMKFKRTCTSTARYMPRIWKGVTASLSRADGTKNDHCPLLAGSYSLSNLSSALLNDNTVPIMFYGRWRVDALLVDSKTRQRLACVRVYDDIVPKIVNPASSADLAP